MKTLNLNEKSFQLEADVFKFLSDYVERINAFVAKNQIEADLHQDILQRLADKLAEKETAKHGISQKTAIQIVNDLGEPDEIFAEEEFSSPDKRSNPKDGEDNTQKPEKAKLFYEKLQNNQRSRPQTNAILLGVCGMFAQVSRRNVRVWRGLILFANRVILAGGMGNFFVLGRMNYFLLALLFPRKEKNYEKRSVLNYLLTQIWDLRLLISNSIKFGFKTAKRILGTAIPTLLKRGGKLFGPLWKIVKAGFLLLRSGFLILVISNLGILFYYLQTGYVWNNVEMTSLFPAITSWGVALGFLSALLLLLGSIGALFRKRLMNTASLIAAIISGILAMIIAGITGIQIFYTFHNSQQENFTKELIIPLPENKQPLTIKVESLDDNFQVLPFNELVRESGTINYIPYEGDHIKTVFSYTILTKNNETLAKITENISDLNYEIKDEVLNISHQNNKLFDNVVPLTPIRYSVDLYIPTDWKFNIANPLYANNLRKPERANKRGYYDSYYDQDTVRCSNWITYDEKENVFFCPMKFSLEKANVRSAIERDIRENKADQLSPLKGLNHDWSFTYGNDDQYWNLHSILWENDQKFIVKLSDQMFNIFLEIEANIGENGEISYIQKTIKEIEQKGVITTEKLKFYKGREQLKEFTIDLEDEKTTTEEVVSKKDFDNLIKKLKENGVLDSEN